MYPIAVAEFSPRGARVVGAVALLSLVAAFVLLLSPGASHRVHSVDADGYSRSAIGHFGLLQLLRDLGLPVLQTRRTTAVGECGVLVLAEPRPPRARDTKRLATMVQASARTLVVLPKRRGRIDPEQPDWVKQVDPLVESEVRAVLEQVIDWPDRPPRIVRVAAATGWRTENEWPAPTMPGLVQLLDDHQGSLEPLVTCEQGILLGRRDTVYVLSDPDLIANHGLHQGANAELVLAVLEHLRHDGTIVFDETMHGHIYEPSIWTAAGEFPLVLVPSHLLLLLALTLWTAHGRFGRALQAPAATAAGKAFLIDNIAALLRRGGHHGPSLRRYCRHRVRDAAERLHAQKGLSDEQYRDWLLSRLHDGAARAELTALLECSADTLTPNQATVTAQRVRTMTEEMLHVVH